MAKCDICSAHCEAARMKELNELYRSEGIRDICDECADRANARKTYLFTMVTHDMVQWTQEQRLQHSLPKTENQSQSRIARAWQKWRTT